MKKIDVVTPVECPTLSPERQLLWDAANYMEKHGLNKRAYHSRRGAVCTLGALNIVATGAPRWQADPRVVSAAALLLPVIGVGSLFNVSKWNDKRERTAAEVIQALRDAALS